MTICFSFSPIEKITLELLSHIASASRRQEKMDTADDTSPHNSPRRRNTERVHLEAVAHANASERVPPPPLDLNSVVNSALERCLQREHWRGLCARILAFIVALAILYFSFTLVVAWLFHVPAEQDVPGRFMDMPPYGPLPYAYCTRMPEAATTQWLYAHTTAPNRILLPSILNQCQYEPVYKFPERPAEHLLKHVAAFKRKLSQWTPSLLQNVLSAEVDRVFVDAHHKFIYRVIMYDVTTGHLEPVLIQHFDLLRRLNQYHAEVSSAMGGDNLIAVPPCVCPLHFGIVGSKMHFLANNKKFLRNPREDEALLTGSGEPKRPSITAILARSAYRILLNVTVLQTADNYEERIESPEMFMGQKVHAFPTNIDKELWPRDMPRTVVLLKQSVTAAYDPVTLLARDTFEEVSPMGALVQKRTRPEIEPPPSATPAHDENAASEFLTQLLFNRTEVRAMIRTTNGAPTKDRRASDACITYCQVLELTVLGKDDTVLL